MDIINKDIEMNNENKIVTTQSFWPATEIMDLHKQIRDLFNTLTQQRKLNELETN